MENLNIVELIKAASASQLARAAFLAVSCAGLADYFLKDAGEKAQLAVFVAMLLFAFALIILLIRPDVVGPKMPQPEVTAPAVPVVKLNELITLLRSLPPERRLSLCGILGGATECPARVEAISDLPVLHATAQVQQAVVTAGQLSTAGPLPPPFLAAAAASVTSDTTAVLTLGRAHQLKVDVFWCEGPGGAALQQLANGIAQKLAASSGKDIGGGTVIGRVRSRMLAARLQGQGYPATSQLLRYEGSERVQAASVKAFVARQTNVQLQSNEISYETPQYVSAFICSLP